jgi:hypothetical protein
MNLCVKSSNTFGTVGKRNIWLNCNILTSGKHQATTSMLVLIVDDNAPTQKWSMRRVINVHPGPDGQVRAITLKTPTGRTARAIAKTPHFH